MIMLFFCILSTVIVNFALSMSIIIFFLTNKQTNIFCLVVYLQCFLVW